MGFNSHQSRFSVFSEIHLQTTARPQAKPITESDDFIAILTKNGCMLSRPGAVAEGPSKYLHTILYIVRNVVFYRLFVQANNANCSCQLFFFFVVTLKGLVCQLAVEHQIRFTKRVDLPTSVALQVVS